MHPHRSRRSLRTIRRGRARRMLARCTRPELRAFLKLVLRPTAYTEFQKHRAGETFIAQVRKASK